MTSRLLFLFSWGFLAGMFGLHAENAPVAAVVKLANPLKMDGDQAVWAAIQAEQPMIGKSGQVGSFKAAYDADNFYALFHVRDSSPLKNKSNVLQEILKGGDALGLCFGTGDAAGNQRILFSRVAGKDVIMALRPHWNTKQPYTYYTAAAGPVPMDFVGSIVGEGAQTHFEITSDGYLAEIKIPWKSLGLQPTASLEFPFDAEIIFSDPAGTTNVDTTWWHSRGAGPACTTDLSSEARLYPAAWGTAHFFEKDPGATTAAEGDVNAEKHGVPITFTLPRACEASLIVSDENGWIARELLRADVMTAGPHTIYWDGRDRWGHILPAGSYHYRVGYFDGIKATFAGSVGNSANPPYRTADGLGSAGGMHVGPAAVAAATDGNFMYLLNSGEEGQPAMRKINIATGKALWFHSIGGFGGGESVASDDRFVYMTSSAGNSHTLRRIDPKTGNDVGDGWKNPTVALDGSAVAGLAVIANKAYLSVPSANRIDIINLETGEKEGTISVPAPQGICRTKTNALLICTGTQVVRLDLAANTQTPLITGLEQATAVAVDSADNIYVSDLGKTQQIKKFSSSGQLVSTFGVVGGRQIQAVPYDPLAFRNVTSLAIGPEGNLWAAEFAQTPRRYAVLTTDGKFVRDIFGPARCGDTVGFDMDDLSSIYHYGTNSQQGEFINSVVDYAAYANSPDPQKGFHVAAVWRLGQRGNVDPAKDPIAQKADEQYSRLTVFTGTNGKRYLAMLGSRVALFLWEKNDWIPCAYAGGTDPTYWSDENGDGIIQPSETTKMETDSQWSSIGKDLTLYGLDGAMKPASIDARGVPKYAGIPWTPFVADPHQSVGGFQDMPSYSAFSMPATSDNSVYACFNNGPHQNLNFWDRTSENRVVKIKDGKLQWMVGNHDGTLAHNGDAVISFGITGESDGVVLVSDVCGEFIGYTADGLALGWALTDDKGAAAVVGSNAIYVENAAPGVFVKDPKTGRHLLLTHTSEDVRIMEITGVFGDDIKRIDGKVTLARSEPRPVQAAGKTVTIPALTWEKSIYEVWRGSNVDANDYEWSPKTPALPITDGKRQVAEIRMRRDAGNLCVFADVLASKPFPISAGTDGGKLFGRSDGVELLFGPISTTPRKTAGPGDTRLFLTATRDANGQLTGHVYACKPASDPVPPSKELSVLQTPGNPIDGGTTAPLDLRAGLVPVPGAMIVVRDRFDHKGYNLEAEIPIALMPEISKVTSVSFYHAGNNDAGLFNRAMRSDLSPALCNAAIWRTDEHDKLQRHPWRNDGFAGVDPRNMNPSLWGVESDPLSVLLGATKVSAPIPLRHEQTTLSNFGMGGGPVRKVSSAIIGGGWFDENGLKFLTSLAASGFEISTGPGIPPVQGDARIGKLDMTGLGIQNTHSLAQRSAKAGDAVTATIKTDFVPNQTGQLHVVWGSYSDNTAGGGDLAITNTATGQTIDKTKAADLSFQIPFNSYYQVRESTFTVSGKGPFNLALNDNGNPQRAVLNAIWIEPTIETTVTVKDKVSLMAYTGPTPAPIKAVEFYINKERLGDAHQAPFNLIWQPFATGNYTITARVIDVLGDTGDSAVARIQVKGREPNRR